MSVFDPPPSFLLPLGLSHLLCCAAIYLLFFKTADSIYDGNVSEKKNFFLQKATPLRKSKERKDQKDEASQGKKKKEKKKNRGRSVNIWGK